MRDDFKSAPKKPRRKIARLAEPKYKGSEPEEMEFKKPEEVAAEEAARSEAFGKERAVEIEKDQKSRGKARKFVLPPFHVKHYFLALGVFSLLLAGGVTANTLSSRVPVDKDPALPKTVYTPPKTTGPSPLTGVEVPFAMHELPVTAVQIENSPDARPQRGLYDAGIVTEAIAEGGITRFNAMFQEAQPDRIGPIRSLRPYYIDFFWPYDASIVHAGGSGQALAEVAAFGLKDIDHGANGGTFYRDSGRFAPHNLYSSRAKLIEAHNARGYGKSNFTPLVRKAEKKAEVPNARGIDVNISSVLYNPHFDYDPNTNSYMRSQAGRPHMDENGLQINPKVVIVLVMPHSYAGIYSVYQTTGSGKAFIFQDGTVTEGIWEKPDRKSQFRFGDANGSPVGLNPGQTWMTLATGADRVTITP
jgi:hypothetical protein